MPVFSTPFLEHYFTIYAAFQEYVDKLTPYVLGKPASAEMAVAFEHFRLYFSEHEYAFLEWHDGVQLINEGIAAFLNDPCDFENNSEFFRQSLMMATTKFEVMSKMAARDLREAHEHIALAEGQEKAEKVTGVPTSALKTIKDLDIALEIARKWLGRAIQYSPWAIEIVRRMTG